MELNKKWNRVILGSQSPRRKELLAGLDIQFEVKTADIDEYFPKAMAVNDVAQFIANNKLDALLPDLLFNELIICSDTVVVLRNEILGKPVDKKEAFAMLRKLSGKTHRVITAVAMCDTTKRVAFSDETLVTFKTLKDDEIQYYLDHYSPYDKAGSYGVQEWIGMMAITKMEGSYFTVMGFPVHKVYDEMINW